MEIGSNLLFFFSALGVFNGLLLAFYILFAQRPRHISSYFLALFFLSLCIRIGKSVVFFFNRDLAYPYLQLGLSFCAIIGPALFLYTRSITGDLYKKDNSWRWHLGFLIPVLLVGGYLFPYVEFVSEWRQYVGYSIYAFWAFYSLLAILQSRKVIAKLFTRGILLINREKWLISLLVGNTAILCAYIFSGLTSYILGAILFSFMLYSVLVILIKGNKKDPILVRLKPLISQSEKAEANALIDQLKSLVETEELFLNADLKIADVADKLKVNISSVSKALNEVGGQNFSNFLNAYRVEHAKCLIRSNSPYTMEALGYDSGFNSKSSFFATFKKLTGQTPAKYKEVSSVDASK